MILGPGPLHLDLGPGGPGPDFRQSMHCGFLKIEIQDVLGVGGIGWVSWGMMGIGGINILYLVSVL